MPDKDILKKEFGRLIKYLRKRQDLTQKGLAEKSGFSHATISKLEQGEYELKLFNLLQLCDALAIDPSIVITAFNKFYKGKSKNAVSAIQILLKN